MSDRIQIAFALAVSLSLIIALMAVVYVALPVVAGLVLHSIARKAMLQNFTCLSTAPARAVGALFTKCSLVQ